MNLDDLPGFNAKTTIGNSDQVTNEALKVQGVTHQYIQGISSPEITTEAEIMVSIDEIKNAVEQGNIEIAQDLYYSLKKGIILGFTSKKLRNFSVDILESIGRIYNSIFGTLENQHTFDVALDKIWCGYSMNVITLDIAGLERIETQFPDKIYCEKVDALIR